MNGTLMDWKLQTDMGSWGWKHTVFSVTELLDGPEQPFL